VTTLGASGEDGHRPAIKTVTWADELSAPAVLYRVSQRKASSRALRSLGQLFRSFSVSLLKLALNDSAAALSALDPTALMLWSTPADLQTSAKVRLVYCEP
jgi:hypothetical protein